MWSSWRAGSCGAVCLRPVGECRVFASDTLVSAAGRAFDPALALRLLDHAIHCCRVDGWPVLHYLADLDEQSLEIIPAHLRQSRIDATAAPASIRLMERLRFGRRSHTLVIALAGGSRGPEHPAPDPRSASF